MDICWLVGDFEPELGRFIEALSDMLSLFGKLGALELFEICQPISVEIEKRPVPSRNAFARRVTNIEPVKLPVHGVKKTLTLTKK